MFVICVQHITKPKHGKPLYLKCVRFLYDMDESLGGRVIESAVINDSLENNENYSEVDPNESATSAAVCEGKCINKTIRKGISFLVAVTISNLHFHLAKKETSLLILILL